MLRGWNGQQMKGGCPIVLEAGAFYHASASLSFNTERHLLLVAHEPLQRTRRAVSCFASPVNMEKDTIIDGMRAISKKQARSKKRGRKFAAEQAHEERGPSGKEKKKGPQQGKGVIVSKQQASTSQSPTLSPMS